MFENLFSTPLDEDRFDTWLVQGRESKIRYSHLVVLWNDLQKDYRPIYFANRAELDNYQENSSTAGDVIVAAYDLFSESKIL